MTDPWQRLDEMTRDIKDLWRALALLDWDQQTYMPKGGIDVRAETSATLQRMAHDLLTSPELGELLDRLAAEVTGLPYESDKASLVRVTRRAYDKAVKLPSRLVQEIAKATALGQNAWEKAREASDFKSFQPYLSRIVELQLEKAHALGFEDDPYDALLDEFEPGMKTRDVTVLFDQLKTRLVPLVHAINERASAVEDEPLHRGFDIDAQWTITMEIIERIGFDLEFGRQDRSAHPFTQSIAPTDVRLTTRFDPTYLGSGIFASIHEAGHGMYEQGLPLEHLNDFLGHDVSLGIHESQSRLWENIVGRSRAFWRHFLPKVKAAFPGKLDDVDVEAMYRAVNKVAHPSMIRVEADEVTYNLHIFLRFELERELVGGRLQVQDLQEAWNEKTRAYLGFVPENDQVGVLQDIHWSCGLFGYFPTYTLGTVLSAQLYECVMRDHPDAEDRIAAGDFGAIKAWMQARIYAHGSRFEPPELIKRATGSSLRPDPYLRYIEEKYRELYGISS